MFCRLPSGERCASGEFRPAFGGSRGQRRHRVVIWCRFSPPKRQARRQVRARVDGRCSNRPHLANLGPRAPAKLLALDQVGFTGCAQRGPRSHWATPVRAPRAAPAPLRRSDPPRSRPYFSAYKGDCVHPSSGSPGRHTNRRPPGGTTWAKVPRPSMGTHQCSDVSGRELARALPFARQLQNRRRGAEHGQAGRHAHEGA